MCQMLLRYSPKRMQRKWLVVKMRRRLVKQTVTHYVYVGNNKILYVYSILREYVLLLCGTQLCVWWTHVLEQQ